MRVAIIGTGNSGCAQACKLMEQGHEVSMVKTSQSLHNENFEYMCSTGTITCIDHTDGHKRKVFHPSQITRDIPKGLAGADAVLILTQSLQHRSLSPLVAPHLKSGQIVLIIPGNMGSLEFRKHAVADDIIFVEAESTPYDARIVTPGEVEILFSNVRNAVSFTEKTHQQYLSRVNQLFGRHKYLRANIIESTLHNPNMIVHTVGSIMSASRIEYAKGEFWMYREAFSPSIWNVIAQLDDEKQRVMRHFGCSAIVSYLDACKWRNEEDLSQDSMAVFQMYAATGGPKGPSTIHTRYIYEDVPMELCLLENLGYYTGEDTPVASALITIASSLLQTDFRTQAYSLSELSDYLDSLK